MRASMSPRTASAPGSIICARISRGLVLASAVPAGAEH
jgi:hypothetical protein